uniref:RNF220 domain-containing protein n=1 Tax=Dracunculus medinensis TaxID=318479 RepID=A0A0N4UQ62_DRAME
LEKLDELRRSLHINNCLDQQEAKTKVEKQKREWYKTIDCPLCGKPLPPGPYRIAHVKKCGRENEISSSKLLSLIEAQTKVAEIKKRSGIAHTK